MQRAASPSIQQHNDLDVFFDATQNQPNTTKRRHRPLDLQRSDITPSRVSRIKDIFEEAACQLASTPPSTGYTLRFADNIASPIPYSSNQQIRLSSHKVDSDYLIDSPRLSTQPSLPTLRSPHRLIQTKPQQSSSSSPSKVAREPLSSGRNTPSRIPRPMKSPIKAFWNAGFTYGEDSDDEDIHSTHGVPLIMPIHNSEPDPFVTATNVSRWLESVENISSDIVDKNSVNIAVDSKTPCLQKGKGKENVPITIDPSVNAEHGSMLAKNKKPTLLGGGPSRSTAIHSHGHAAHKASHQKQLNPESLLKHTPPTGLLLHPPRRMGLTPGTGRSSTIPKKVHNSESKLTERPLRRVENFAHLPGPIMSTDDDGLLKLSPSVTKYRKGRGNQPNVLEKQKEKSSNNVSAENDYNQFIHELQEDENLEESHRGRKQYRV